MTETNFENLLDYVSHGRQVVIWYSINLVELARRYFYKSEYYTLSYTIVLLDYHLSTVKVILTDSISGVVEADFKHVKYLYNLFCKKA